LDTIDGDLTADKEDEECNCCPEDLFTEWDLYEDERGGSILRGMICEGCAIVKIII